MIRTGIWWRRALQSRLLAFALAIGGAGLGQFFGQVTPVDTANSRLIVHVSKAGLLSAFADNHEVEARLSEGVIDETARRVRLVVDTRRMNVLDPHLSPEKRQQVQERMLGPDVLDTARFPEVTFESTVVDEADRGHLVVHGRLSLHGVTRVIAMEVRNGGSGYVGTATLKQRDFGITPVTIAGGTVKVKNELQIEFDIRKTNRVVQTSGGWRKFLRRSEPDVLGLSHSDSRWRGQ
jgi:hypothetical protein